MNSEARQQSPAAAGSGESAGLLRSRIFHGILLTQFLGAFNDNYFKQMVLLKCTELAQGGKGDLQPIAMAAFALPFVLLSGLGGYASDRWSKRTIIVLCKVAEIVVMASALAVLLLSASPRPELILLIAVLGMMGAQSAVFGPSKYGVLPELFRPQQLLAVNGAIQMTTFLAIIFGMAAAGVALDSLDNSLWLCSVVAVGIAVCGTLTSLMIRRTPASHPGLRITKGNLFIPQDTWAVVRRVRGLTGAILVAMMFWFIGGVTQPAVNSLGEQFRLNNTRTSLLVVCIGIGIAAGCASAGLFSRRRNAGPKLVRAGGLLITVTLLATGLLGSGIFGRPSPSLSEIPAAEIRAQAAAAASVASAGNPVDLSESMTDSMLFVNAAEWSLRGTLFLLGFAAGLFVVPVQVFIQTAPPSDQKGRMIGVQNFLSWIGILLSALFLGCMNLTLSQFRTEGEPVTDQHLVFFVLAAVMLPVVLFYRLPEQPSESETTNPPAGVST